MGILQALEAIRAAGGSAEASKTKMRHYDVTLPDGRRYTSIPENEVIYLAGNL